MRVHVAVRDRTIVIDCAAGFQRVKWLAMVATQRYDDLASVSDGHFSGAVGNKHVPFALEEMGGRRIPPTKIINRLPVALAAQHGGDVADYAEPRVRVILLADVPPSGRGGTTSFLTAIAAVPEMCLVNGLGLVSCAPRRHAAFTVYCRDNFSIPIANGGEDLSVQFTSDTGVKQRAEVTDGQDGCYTVVYSLPKRGSYTVDITIDGDHVVGSPFECVAVESELPPTVKFLRPAFCNGAPPTAEDGVELAGLRALHLSPTDALLLADRLDVAWALHLPNFKYTRHPLRGQFPPPAAQCPAARAGYACALVAGRVYLHGGACHAPAAAAFAPAGGGGRPLLDASGQPTLGDGARGERDAHVDAELWCLDVEARTWLAPQTKGRAPPGLVDHACCAHASRLFVHGGRLGRSRESRLNGDLFVLATCTLSWDTLNAACAPGGAVPAARWGHSLTEVGARLFLFGGQGADGALLAQLYAYDVAANEWSQPRLVGLKPRARRGHAAAVWGSQLLIAHGTAAADDPDGSDERAADGSGCCMLTEIAAIEIQSMLAKAKRPALGAGEAEKLACSTHSASVYRTGHSLLVSRGALLVVGGSGGGSAEAHALPLAFVPAGHMLLQEKDTEVIVPQPGARLPHNYSIEAWICAAVVQPMNIVCKTSARGAKNEWSHQLRLDADGRVEHALSLGRGESWLSCRSTAKLHRNHWYYVVGTLTIGETDADILNLRLYVNGAKDDEEVGGGASSLRADHLDRFCIGGESGGGYGPFIGAIADVSVWSYALMPESIANSWVNHAQPELHEPHLVGHWKLNEGHLPAATDASPNLVSAAGAAPLGDVARTNLQTVFDYSIYAQQGVVLGAPRCSATTCPLYYDARKHPLDQ